MEYMKTTNQWHIHLSIITVYTTIVTASLTTPAIVTVTALVIDTRMYSVKTCNRKESFVEGRNSHQAYWDQEEYQINWINKNNQTAALNVCISWK